MTAPNTENDFWLLLDREGKSMTDCWSWRGKNKQFFYKGQQWEVRRLCARLLHWDVPSLPIERRWYQICGNKDCVNFVHSSTCPPRGHYTKKEYREQ